MPLFKIHFSVSVISSMYIEFGSGCMRSKVSMTYAFAFLFLI